MKKPVRVRVAVHGVVLRRVAGVRVPGTMSEPGTHASLTVVGTPPRRVAALVRAALVRAGCDVRGGA